MAAWNALQQYHNGGTRLASDWLGTPLKLSGQGAGPAEERQRKRAAQNGKLLVTGRRTLASRLIKASWAATNSCSEALSLAVRLRCRSRAEDLYGSLDFLFFPLWALWPPAI